MDGRGEREGECGDGSEAVLVEVDGVLAQCSTLRDGEGLEKTKHHYCGNQMGVAEGVSGRDLHEWSSFLFETDSGALEDDSVKKQC